MAGENNGSSPAPGISAPSPPPAGRLTGVFPVALPVTPPILGTPPEVPASPRDRGTARPPLPVPSPRRIPRGQQPPEPHGHLQRTRCPRIVDQTPPGCAHDAHGASTILQPGRPGSDRRVTLVPSAAPASHPPTTPPPFPGCGKLSKQADGAGGAAAARRRAEKAIFSRYIFYKSNILCSSALPVKPSRDRAPGRKSRRRRGTTPPGSPRQKSHEWGPNAPSPPFRVGDSLPRCWGSTGRILAHDHEPCACPVPPAARGHARRWARTRPRCSPAVPRTWKLNMLSKHGEQTEHRALRGHTGRREAWGCPALRTHPPCSSERRAMRPPGHGVRAERATDPVTSCRRGTPKPKPCTPRAGRAPS